MLVIFLSVCSMLCWRYFRVSAGLAEVCRLHQAFYGKCPVYIHLGQTHHHPEYEEVLVKAHMLILSPAMTQLHRDRAYCPSPLCAPFGILTEWPSHLSQHTCLTQTMKCLLAQGIP